MAAVIDATDEARSLLLAHAERNLTGRIDDPATMAAVVGIERLVVATGSTDASVLRAAVAGRPSGSGTAGADQTAIGDVVAQSLRHVTAGLQRRATGQSIDAVVVNPEAGAYPVTQDATLVRAAVRAAQRSIDAMPYYGARYGERGARFASSDSAWLVSLARLDPGHAIRQVEWLSRLLAGRGMPTWLMELHLVELVAEVRTSVDDDAVGALPDAAASLADARRRHVPDELLHSAGEWALDLAGDRLPIARTGELIAAGTADVLLGVVRDDQSLVDWLTDRERATATTVAAIHEVRNRVLRHAT